MISRVYDQHEAKKLGFFEDDHLDFIKSDLCTDCDGSGQIRGEQCLECEHLHRLELRADRLHDEMKGA